MFPVRDVGSPLSFHRDLLIDTKLCPGCDQSLPLSCFRPSILKPGQLQALCSFCAPKSVDKLQRSRLEGLARARYRSAS